MTVARKKSLIQTNSNQDRQGQFHEGKPRTTGRSEEATAGAVNPLCLGSAVKPACPGNCPGWPWTGGVSVNAERARRVHQVHGLSTAASALLHS